MSDARPGKPIHDLMQTHDDQKAPTSESFVTAGHDASEASTPKPEKPVLITPAGSLKVSKASPRPKLQGHATTAVSRAEIQLATQAERSPSTSTSISQAQSRRSSFSRPKRQISRVVNETDDNASVRSGLSSLGTAWGAESLLGLVLDTEGQLEDEDEEETVFEEDAGTNQKFESQFSSEFVEIDNLKRDGSNDEALMLAWSLKLKHFFILSSAGKPIWSRHGDDELISNSIGVIQTIISFYQGASDTLKSFTAGDARFCILSKGHLYLVAVSRMGENDTQLRAQLEALYMQILSTLTLVNMEKIFLNRPSTDLRRPLQGTEKLLCALADGFTRGSPSTLLSALECLRLRKADRTAINNCFSKARAPNLLYGLLITDTGQLVSVLRPRKHSLHPGDLQLIFNMLFEAKSIRTGGGESWVPLCLPGFNNTGFVYMYVSFLDIGLPSSPLHDERHPSMSPARGHPPTPNPKPHEFTLVLISASPHSFDDLRTMRDTLVASIIGSTSPATDAVAAPLLQPLRTALATPRVPLSHIVPHSPVLHFLYKSRLHVQFFMPDSPHFPDALSWRRLMTRYATLHASVHGRVGGKNKVVHLTGRDGVGAAWATQEFEVYAVAERGAPRDKVARGVEAVVKWVKREEERVFVVGGTVF